MIFFLHYIEQLTNSIALNSSFFFIQPSYHSDWVILQA